MAKFETNMGFVRAIASWQPITKNASGSLALENIAMMIDGNDILITATDRYRLVYARVRPEHMETWDGKKLFPMSVFTDAVTVHKTVADHVPVVFDMPDEATSFTVTVADKTLEYLTPTASFPALENLLNDWKRVETWPNDNKLNMKLLIDIPKFANPNGGVLTAARRDYGWIMTLGESRAIRFHQGDMERFGLLFMPMTVR
jgi:hypothetical protein